MKANLLVWALLLAGMAAVRLPAQTLQTLVSFNFTNGANPNGLTLGTDGNFYGTTFWGGSSNYGTVFKMTMDGTLTTLASFNYTNGANSWCALTLGTDGNFYGTTKEGGSYGGSDGGYGTVFQVTTNGVLTTLVSFARTNGANPEATALTLGNDSNFYGVTDSGGSHNEGTVFKVTTNGTLTMLVSFNGTNGADPYGALAPGSDGNFYGTTAGGGSTNSTYPFGGGTVFRVTTNGTLTTLASFINNGTNGGYPEAGLTLDNDGNFYGTTTGDGIGNGTVFQVTTNGVLTTLASFGYNNGADGEATALTLGNDGNFYGTTQSGGSYHYGIVFQVTTNGVLTTLVSFNGTNGAFPQAALTLGTDGNFYGTTSGGGITNSFDLNGCGTVFRLLLPPVITAPRMLANGQFQFSFDTTTRVDYAVEYSTNLTQWLPLVTLGGVGVPLTVVDPNTASSQQRFYRIILSPQ